ncbi:50S ribosome-binding protein YggL [Hymenobacter elongatus]|uniref:DUF469 family protein n=1 Tax=Hymenobacter elongatus TaxID=877208 RepID=A0A4Z0PEW7_9BACT|nr:50S ribosome-binding protein YggL [Hymenobacter elongatus]TGE13115.1 DUF469 family protein [Hymenobacter elongatus]
MGIAERCRYPKLSLPYPAGFFFASLPTPKRLKSRLEQIEEFELIIGGALDDFAATPVKRLSQAQAQEKQQQLQQWLQARPEVAQATSTELIDAYYGPFRT